MLSGKSRDKQDIDILSENYQRLLEDYHVQGQILEVSNRILRSGNTSNTLEEAFKTVIDICQSAFGADTSVIELFDEQQHKLVGVATDYGPYNPEGYFELPLDEQSLSGMAFKAGHTVAIDDVVNDPRVSQRIRRIFSARSGIAAPLIVDGKSIGVLLTMMNEREHSFNARDVNLMEGLAAEAALAVHTQMLHKQRIQAEHRFQRLVENAPSVILLIDQNCTIQEANHRAVNVFEESDLVGKRIEEFIAADELERVLSSFKSLRLDSSLTLEATIVSKNNHFIDVAISANLLSIAGQLVIQAFFLDITQRKLAEAALYEEKERAQITLSSIADGVVVTDQYGVITSINPKAETLTGWSAEDARGQAAPTVLKIADEETQLPISGIIDKCLHKGQPVELAGSAVLARRNGGNSAVELSIAPMRDRSGKSNGAVIVIHDVSEARKMADEMQFLATHDTLTGLVNRGEFERRLNDAIQSAGSNDIQYALCYLDLDRFKVVNDTAGHVAGDELLIQLTALLKSKVRNSDTLARLGGDEFGVLLHSCPLDKASEIAESIRRLVKEFRFVWEGKTFEIGASIGVIAISAQSGELKEILSAVDTACYLAKEQGRNRIHIFRPGDEEIARRHGEMELTHRIRRAIKEDRFVLWQQPLEPLNDELQHIQACEIFVRMLDERDQIIYPSVFIPAAERYQLMPDIDRWVVRAVFKAIQQEQLLQDEQSYCFINLSGQSLGDNDLLQLIVDKLDSASIAPERICFEITETAAISNLAHAINFVTVLESRGCCFALDDFGSGLSSFAYLKNLPVDFIKIDGHFIRDMVQNPVDRTMVEAISKIGHVMGIQTIGEFVEDTATRDALKQAGVDYAQGNGIARPKPL
ncbi:MAG: EAL domain-containing protein [Gammaproteobacteria bacterium]|jgi:diguanylate cyclase (GGDEF)-like protein/PAS domain S-box-containing protein